MKCFYLFKEKRTDKKSKSAPELREQTTTNVSENRVSKSANSASSSTSIPELYKKNERNLRVFTFDELREATNDFNRMLKIGEGGFGSVYKGTIKPPNGKGNPTVVAIKKLKKYGLQVFVSIM